MKSSIVSVSALAALTLFMVAALVTVGGNTAAAPQQLASAQTAQANG